MMYRSLLLLRGRAFTLDHEFPEPMNLNMNKKAQGKADRRVKGVLAVVNSAAQFVKALNESNVPIANEKDRLDIVSATNLPSQLKKKLACSTEAMWVDVSLFIHDLHCNSRHWDVGTTQACAHS